MDNQLVKTFDNDDLNCSIETVCKDGVVYLKATDVARALGYENDTQAIRAHVDGDDKVKLNELLPAELQRGEAYRKNTIYIKESGLYSLIFRSDKSKAKGFKTWVTSEVLPSIRKTGQYSVTKNILQLQNERSLHYRVVNYLKRYYPDAVVIPGLGENQDTSDKRIDSKRKGYEGGQCD